MSIIDPPKINAGPLAIRLTEELVGSRVIYEPLIAAACSADPDFYVPKAKKEIAEFIQEILDEKEEREKA